ncbi:hypothetical protein AG1IA_00821 [Rhizoctonia solani AG-1 IA]|uniref:Uncharacterized protein n=1 Tax=Thanatephorus cucumeris (strain AG1-IA) TaxID=983506 RepID=L8X7T1_THACA|nr:hypothetical protein AG1IA_00821 [Rhizoctonia solani AG-1 IA]
MTTTENSGSTVKDQIRPKCRIAELEQFKCTPVVGPNGFTRVHCTPIPRIFRMSLSKSARGRNYHARQCGSAYRRIHHYLGYNRRTRVTYVACRLHLHSASFGEVRGEGDSEEGLFEGGGNNIHSIPTAMSAAQPLPRRPLDR